MTNLETLAERIERATEPDFAIDSEIAVAAAGYVREKRDRDKRPWFYHPTERRRNISEFSGFDRLPRYTASFDDAMSLAVAGISAPDVLRHAIERCVRYGAPTFIEALPRFVAAEWLRAIANQQKDEPDANS